MEARRQEQALKAIDDERDGSLRNRKPEDFPNSISVGALMDDSGTAASKIDIAGERFAKWVITCVTSQPEIVHTNSSTRLHDAMENSAFLRGCCSR